MKNQKVNTKVKIVLISVFLLLTSNLIYADIVLKETFVSTATPSGWSLIRSQGSFYWTIQNSPAFSSPSGGYYAVFDDDSHGAAHPNEAYIRTKSFDCTGMTSVKLSFYEFWEGMENTFGYVEVSIDGGTIWTTVLTHEETTVGSLAAPNKTIIDISTQAAGEDDVMLRFRYLEDVGQSNAWYIDDVVVYSANDVGVSALAQPAYLNCTESYTSSENISIRLFNYSNEDVTGVSWSLTVTGGAAGTWTGSGVSISADDYIDVFVTTLDMSADAVYHFDITATLANDGYLANNNFKVGRQQVVETYPYLADFNASRSGWLEGGDNPQPTNSGYPTHTGRQFSWGVLDYLNGAEGEGNSWFVEASIDYKYDFIWLESPIFDFSENSTPYLYFDLKHSLHDEDYFQVQYQIDGGTWTQLGSEIDVKWYNALNWWRNSMASPVDSWTEMEYDLCFLSGESCVKFRMRGRPRRINLTLGTLYQFAIDNFKITGTLTDDVEPIAITQTNAKTCSSFSSTETIQVLLKNNGCRPLTNFPITLNIDGGFVATETVNVTIPPFEAEFYTFVATADLSASGTRIIEIVTGLTSDDVSSNNTYSENRLNSVISTFPYLADFDGASESNDGWVSQTLVGHRYFRNEEIPYLNGEQGNGKSFYVEVTQDYKYDFISVESPVFNLNGLSDPVLYMDIKHKLHNDDYFRVQYSKDGGSNWITLGTTQPDWYNTNGYWRNSLTEPVDEWTQVMYSLCEIADLDPGEKNCIKFRINGRPRRADLTNDELYHFAFDNFEIIDNPEVGVTEITNPNAAASICLYEGNQTVSISVYNFGCGTIYNVPVKVQIDLPVGHPDFASSPLTFIGTVPSIDAQSSSSYTFATTFNMLPLGTYDFDAWSYLTGDVHPENDHAYSTISVDYPKISTFPYLENFNTGHDHYWSESGDNPPDNNGRRFVCADLPSDYLNGSDGEGRSWRVVANTDYKYDFIWVESPVFDFSENSNPVVSFDIKHSLHNEDYFQVRYQVDGGTWTQLGGEIDPLWYNAANWWRNSFSAPVETWTHKEYDLCFLSGESCVKFEIRGRPSRVDVGNDNLYKLAFDNFSITGSMSDDVEPIAITLPGTTDCLGAYSSSEAVQVLLKNNLCRPLSNFDIELYVDNILQATENVNVSIPAFEAELYTFATTIDLSVAGTHEIKVITKLASDQDNTNDTYSEIRVQGIINTFPYTADFNTNNNGFVSHTPVGHRYFRHAELPYLNGAGGEGKSWYVNVTQDNKWDFIEVESPNFDLSAMTDPLLYMDIKHELHSNDYFQVRYSINGGTWTQLGSSEPGWYNNTSWWQNSMTSPVSEWERVQINLCNLSSETCIKFKIVGRPFRVDIENDNLYKFAFDNFTITEAIDVSVTEISSPLLADNGCTFLTNQQVSIKTYNVSCNDLTDVPVECLITLPAGHPLAPSITLTGIVPNIPANGFADYTFTTTFDMTPIGTYGFDAYTALVGDFNPANDHTTSSIFVEFPKLSTFPYEENFNTGHDHYWIAKEDDLVIGREFLYGALPYLNGAESEGESWYVSGTIDYNDYFIWVESPVFDFSTIVEPVILFDIKHKLHVEDYFRVEYSINGGDNWFTVDDTGTEPDWYNTADWWRNSFSNPVDEWTTVRHNVCDLAGQPCVKFRVRGQPRRVDITNDNLYEFAFDNFKIVEQLQDVAVVQYISPLQSDEDCSFPTDQEVTVQVYNPFCSPLIDVPMTCEITGAITQTLTGVVDIPAKSYVNYTFPTTVDMTTVGNYDFDTYTTFVDDYFPNNNQILQTITVDNILITTFPYLADFNSGKQFWREGGENPPLHENRDFILGQFDYLNGNESNGEAWYVEVTDDSKWSFIWVESPVFDLTQTMNPVLSMEIKYQLHNENKFQVQYSIDGGSSWSQLGTGNADWYNNTNWWQNNAQSPINEWTYVEYGLCQLKNYSCVKFRVRGRPYRNAIYAPYYFAFDNFTISDALIDAAIIDVTGCYGEAQNYILNVEVQNNNNNICELFEPCTYDGQHDLLFDGVNDRVSLGSFPAFTDFTVEYWVKLNGTDGDYDRITSTTSSRFETAKQGSDGRLRFYSPATGWKWTNAYLPEGIWSHVSWVSNGSKIILYLNGENVYEYNANVTIAASDWYLGGIYTSGFCTNISLDEVRIWSKALTEEEVRTNICNGLVGNETDLEAYYDMESTLNTTTLLDVTANNHDGTLENMNITNSCWVTPAPLPFAGSNEALQFDDVNDRVETAELPAMINWTTEYWMYNPLGSSWQYNVSAKEGDFCTEINNAGDLCFRHVSDPGDNYTTIDIPANTWTHIAVTSDGSQVYFYKNGVLEYTHPATIALVNSKWYIGARYDGAYPNAGIIDEVRIWNTTRSQAEISANMSSVLTLPQTKLVAYYKLDDGIGSYTATDETGNYDAELIMMVVGSCWETSTLLSNNNGTAAEAPDITSIDITYELDGGGTVTNTYTSPADFTAISAGTSEIITIPFEQIQGSMFGSNIITGGTASASHERNADNVAANAFNNDIEDYGWGSNISPSWLQYDLGAGNEQPINAYRFYCSSVQISGWNSENNNPGTWTVQGSDDASAWTDLHHVQTGAVTMDTWATYFIDNTTSYRYYRIYIDYGELSSWTHITEMQYFNIDPDMSEAFVEISEPNGLTDQIVGNNSMFVDIASFPHCNDWCENAIEIVNTITNATSNDNATINPDEDPPFNTGCTGVTLENTAWYYFTTNCTGGDVDVTFDNIVCAPGGTGIQVSITRLDAEPACDIANHTEVFCDYPGDETDIVWNGTDLPPDQVYYITIDGVSGNTCDFKILLEGNVSFDPANAMQGNREINGTGNFPTIQAAVDSLEMYGVQGPIVFTVADIPFDEQIEIGLICGTDETNTITFKTWCDDCGNATLQHNADATENYTLKLNRTEFINFEKFAFKALGSTNTRAIEIANGANNITFNNNFFTGINTSDNSDAFAVIYTDDATNPNNIIFNNNLFKDGSIGLYMVGMNTTQNISGLTLTGNRFVNQAYSAINLQNVNATEITQNIITSNSTRTDFRGISFITCNNDLILTGNDISAISANGYGLFLDDVASTSGNEALIANNMFSIGTSGASYGINIESTTGNSEYLKLYHNSINMLSATGSAFRVNTADNISIINNCFVSASATSYDVTGLTNETEDYNNFLPSFAGNNSISINPSYMSAGNLHTENSGLAVGTNTIGINLDIDGETRQNPPFIGADEYLGDVQWTGNTDNDWNKSTNWNPGTAITDNTNVVIPTTPSGGSYPETNSHSTNLAEAKNMTIQTGSHLYVAPGKYLTVWGDLNQNGTFILQSDASATASFINKGAINYGGSATTTMQQHIDGAKWHYVSSPITNANSSIFNSPNFYTYNETYSDTWSGQDFGNPALMGWEVYSGVLGVADGYITYQNAQTVNFTGEFNTGDITHNLSYTAAVGNNLFDGWNLSGNPYPSSINWENSDITRVNVDNAVYFYQDDGSGAYNNYSYFVPSDWTSPYASVAINRVSGCIPPNQSYFVKADGAGASITYRNETRVHNDVGFYKTEIIDNPVIRLQAEMNGKIDETVIRFIPDATESYDGEFDAHKLPGSVNGTPAIYSLAMPDSTNIAINTLSEINLETIIPVAIYSPETGICNISINDLIIPDDFNAFFFDKLTNDTILLKENITFEILVTEGNVRNRYEIIFEEKELPTGDIDNEKNTVSIFSSSNNVLIIIKSKDVIADVEIFNIVGQKVYQGKTNSSFTQIPLNTASGNYVVKLIYNNEIIVGKVFIGN